jgi:hypothetical protein
MSLSPRWKRQIVYTDGPAIRILTYEITSGGPRTLSNVPLIDFGSGIPANVDFSPAGTHVVYLDPRDKGIYIHDLSSGIRTQIAAQAQELMDLEFNHDGSKVIYSLTIDPTLLNVQFKSVPVTGGLVTDLPIQGKYGSFNVGHSDDRIVADTPGDWDTGAITLISEDGSSLTRLATGYAPAFYCGSHLLYQRRNLSSKGAVSILKLDLASGTTSTYSSADNMWADGYPDCS